MCLAYAIAFLYLLRLDEVLNIKIENIRFLDTDTGKVELMLNFRKTHQTGGTFSIKSCFRTLLIVIIEVQPFYLYFMPERPWLDVPMLLVEWLHISKIMEGFLFRPFFSLDQPKLTEASKKLVSILN